MLSYRLGTVNAFHWEFKPWGNWTSNKITRVISIWNVILLWNNCYIHMLMHITYTCSCSRSVKSWTFLDTRLQVCFLSPDCVWVFKKIKKPTKKCFETSFNNALMFHQIWPHQFCTGYGQIPSRTYSLPLFLTPRTYSLQ